MALRHGTCAVIFFTAMCGGCTAATGSPPEAPPKETPAAKQTATTAPLTGTWRLLAGEDVTTMWFDRIDIDHCALAYEGTGGTSVRRWQAGTCKVGADHIQIEGTWLGSCFGMTAHPPWCDPTDASRNETVSKSVPMERIDRCTIRLDGQRFQSLACVEKDATP